jgi:tRNA dimethylallyltransferase
MQKPQLVVICGPTASGKTALAVDIAREFDGEVVSADSMQVYRSMDIGTAKPEAAEMRGIPHHMIDCADISGEYSAAIYREQARACIAGIAARGKLPILCGGTGLYISSAVYPLDFDNTEADEGYRSELAAIAAGRGNEALHALLAVADPIAAGAIHPNNVKRVIRALEKARAAGSTISSPGGQQLFNSDPLYDLAWVGLTMERSTLYARINVRVDGMMARGLLEEVRSLADRYGRDSVAFQALGYKELLDYLDEKTELNEAVEQIKTGTRNYAKRQLTWFRREKCIRWFDAGELPQEELARAVAGYIRSTLHI